MAVLVAYSLMTILKMPGDASAQFISTLAVFETSMTH